MNRTLICLPEGISASGMRIPNCALAPNSRPQIITALLLLVVFQTFLLPPATVDVFGDLALREDAGASLHSMVTGAQSQLARDCRSRIHTCSGRLAAGHARRPFRVESMPFDSAHLHAEARAVEPQRLSSVAALPPPTPPPRRTL